MHEKAKICIINTVNSHQYYLFFNKVQDNFNLSYTANKTRGKGEMKTEKLQVLKLMQYILGILIIIMVFFIINLIL
jgi:hypothetical protein